MIATNRNPEDIARLEEFKGRAKQILLEIVRQAPDGQFKGKLALFKAFYLAHLLYAEKSPGYLTEWPIVRMPNGPGIHAADQLLLELAGEGVLEVHSRPRLTATSPPEEYRWVRAEAEEAALPQAAVEAIREAVAFVRPLAQLQG